MDEQDDFGDENHDQGPIVNKNPYLLISAFSTVISFLESYGWYMLFGVICAMVIWTNIRDSLKRFFGKRKRDVDITDFMSPEQVESRMRAMDAARLRMQENYDKLVEARAESLRERENEKRERMINDHEALKQGKSQSGTLNKMDSKASSQPKPSVIKRNKDAKPIRGSDYNPLGGSSSSSRFRPNPRPARGGG